MMNVISNHAGTGSLSRALTYHPKFCNETIKEKHFFPVDYAKGIQWYINLFPMKCTTSEEYLTLDATPGYIRNKQVPVQIKELYGPDEVGKKKFILIFRDPVARLVVDNYSQIDRHVSIIT